MFLLSYGLGGHLMAEPQNVQVFGHWTMHCEISEKETRQTQCTIFQNVVLRKGGQRVLHLAIGYIPNQEMPVALVTLPLGISLPPGASIQVDKNEPVSFPIERCEVSGCRGGIKLSPQIVTRFKEGRRAYVIFHDQSREPIKVAVSLKGFAEGLEALRGPAPLPPVEEAPPAVND